MTELEQVGKLSGELKTWDEFTDMEEDASPFLVLPSDLVREECLEWLSNLQVVVTEYISNDEIFSDRAENGNVISLDLQNTEQLSKERLERKFQPVEDMTREDVAEDKHIIELSPISMLEEEINKSRGASVE